MGWAAAWMVIVFFSTCGPTNAQMGPGTAFVFAGAGSLIVTTADSLPPPWTVELWVRRHDSPVRSAPLFINATNALKLEQDRAGRRVGFTTFGKYDYFFDYRAPADEWTHLAFAANETEICLFTNGVFHSCISTSMPLPLVYFGSIPSSANDQLRAEVDELRVWRTELVQVSEHMHHRLTGAESNLFLYWRCDDAYGDFTLNNATNQMVPYAELINVGNVPSGVPFPPELGQPFFRPGQANEFVFGCPVHPGNVPTTLEFLAAGSLQLTNVRQDRLTNELDQPSTWRHPLPAGPDGRVILGRLIASNTFGVVTSEVARGVAPFIDSRGLETWTNECHRPLLNPGVSARMGPAALAAGVLSSTIVQPDGSVVEWGGDPTDEILVPRQARNVVGISAFAHHRLAVRTDGVVLSWGMTGTTVPPNLGPAVAAAAGFGHGLALMRDGKVVAWGRNNAGQTNVPAAATNVVAIAAGSGHSVALTASGRVLAWGARVPGPMAVPAAANTNITAVAAGSDHCLALTASGRVVAWGDNQYGQVNVPAGLANAVAVSGGFYHSLALLADGKVVAWGQNQYHQCNVPLEVSNAVAIAAGGAHSLALLANGEVVAWGNNAYGQCDVPAPDPRLALTVSLDPGGPPESTGRLPVQFGVSNAFGLFSIELVASVVDTSAPRMTVIGNNPYRTFRRLPFVDPGVTIVDECDPAVTVITNGAVDITRLGSYSIAYEARDASGNVSRASRVVTVEDWPFSPGDVDGDGKVDRGELSAVLDHLNGNGTVSPADFQLVRDRYEARPLALRMTNVISLGGSRVGFSLGGDSFISDLEVEYSSDLRHWIPLGPVALRYEFADPGARGTEPMRVYRVRHP